MFAPEPSDPRAGSCRPRSPQAKQANPPRLLAAFLPSADTAIQLPGGHSVIKFSRCRLPDGTLSRRRYRPWAQCRADPTFDTVVEISALPDLNYEATVVVGTHVLADRPRVVPLEHSPVELCWLSAPDGRPELLRRGHICSLVDMHAESQLRRLDSGHPSLQRTQDVST